MGLMATAPGISTPGAPASPRLGSALVGLGRDIRRERARKEREEKKQREIFELMSLQNDVDGMVQAELDALPANATPVMRYAAVRRATEGAVSAYNDQDPKKGQQAKQWAEKTWIDPYRTKSETYQNTVQKEALSGEYAATYEREKLHADAAFRRSLIGETEEERQAAFSEYRTRSEKITELARIADPHVAGEQVAEWNRERPANAMNILREHYGRNGQLTQFQSAVRRGEFKLFYGKMTPDARRAFDEALSKEIGQEALKRKRLLDAENAAEEDRQNDLVDKYSVLDSQLSSAEIDASARADGATGTTVKTILANRESMAVNADKIDTRNGKAGMEAGNDDWMNGLVLGSKQDVLEAQIENARRQRTGVIDPDIYQGNKAELENRGKLIDLMGEEMAGRLADNRAKLKLFYGLRETPDTWSHQQNAYAARFREVADAADAMAVKHNLPSDVHEEVIRLGMLNLVSHDLFAYDRTRLRHVKLDPELDDAGKKAQRQEIARGATRRLLGAISKRLADANIDPRVLHDYLMVAGPDQGVVPIRRHATYTDGSYDQLTTHGKIFEDPDMTEDERVAAVTANDATAQVTHQIFSLPDFQTKAEQIEETKRTEAELKAQQEIDAMAAAESAAEAERQSQQVGPERTGEAPRGPRRPRAQTFALGRDDEITIQELGQRQTERAGGLRRAGEQWKRYGQVVTESRKRLEDRDRSGQTGQMGRRRRRR